MGNSFLFVLDSYGVQIFTLNGIWQKSYKIENPMEKRKMTVVYPFVYINSIFNGIVTLKIET